MIRRWVKRWRRSSRARRDRDAPRARVRRREIHTNAFTVGRHPSRAPSSRIIDHHRPDTPSSSRSRSIASSLIHHAPMRPKPLMATLTLASVTTLTLACDKKCVNVDASSVARTTNQSRRAPTRSRVSRELPDRSRHPGCVCVYTPWPRRAGRSPCGSYP